MDSRHIDEEFDLQGVDEKRRRIMRVLNTPAEERTDQEVSLIQSIFEDNKFLKQFKGTSKLRELCRHLRVEQYDES